MLHCSKENHTSRHLRNKCVYCINASNLFLRQCCFAGSTGLLFGPLSDMPIFMD